VRVVRDVLARRGESTEVTLDLRFEDLDLSSLDTTEIFLQLEELAGRELDPEESARIDTIADLVEVLAQPA